MNWYKRSSLTLAQQLTSLRPQMAVAAQNVYDNWIQDEFDDLNGGGICQDIAEAISSVISQNISDVSIDIASAQVCEQHVWCIAHRNYGDSERFEGFHADIPPGVYETGGGYTWQKIPDITFDASDISIFPAKQNEISPDGY